MTEEHTENEKKAEEYAQNCKYVETDYFVNKIAKIKAIFLDGLAEGKPKWHDLRKNPDDLPKAECLIVTRYHNGTYSPVHFYLGGKFNDDVIAWCELPKFEE